VSQERILKGGNGLSVLIGSHGTNEGCTVTQEIVKRHRGFGGWEAPEVVLVRDQGRTRGYYWGVEQDCGIGDQKRKK